MHLPDIIHRQEADASMNDACLIASSEKERRVLKQQIQKLQAKIISHSFHPQLHNIKSSNAHVLCE
jgi:hypothetical protein